MNLKALFTEEITKNGWNYWRPRRGQMSALDNEPTYCNSSQSNGRQHGCSLFDVGQSHKAYSSNRSPNQLHLFCFSSFLLLLWWVEIYCTLKTNWKNNLTGLRQRQVPAESHACMRRWARQRWTLPPSCTAQPPPSRQARPKQSPYLHTGQQTSPLVWLRLKWHFSKVQLAVLPSAKLTFLAGRRRRRRTAASPSTWRPPRSRWPGRNIRCCWGESSRRTWRRRDGRQTEVSWES